MVGAFVVLCVCLSSAVSEESGDNCHRCVSVCVLAGRACALDAASL